MKRACLGENGKSFFSIGFHRSILTHSILLGIAVETIAISSIRLTQIIHKNLPNNHDIFWDKAKEQGEYIIKNLATGASFGIAYHLFVNATMHEDKAYAVMLIYL